MTPESFVYYKTGLPEFDDDHKKLFDMIDQIAKVKYYEEAEALATDLHEYVHDHFKHEEAFMEKNNYRYFAAHKDAHYILCKEFNKVCGRMLTRNAYTPPDKFSTYVLEDLFRRHIEQWDIPYGDPRNFLPKEDK